MMQAEAFQLLSITATALLFASWAGLAYGWLRQRRVMRIAFAVGSTILSFISVTMMMQLATILGPVDAQLSIMYGYVATVLGMPVPLLAAGLGFYGVLEIFGFT